VGLQIANCKFKNANWKIFNLKFSIFNFQFAILLFSFVAHSAALLQFEGDDHLPRRKIEAAMALPDKPLAMSDEDWEDWQDEAVDALSDAYQEIGYFDAAFRFERRPGEGAKSADGIVKVTLREGPRYRFGRVTVVHADGSAPIMDPDDLKSRAGKPFDRDLVFRDRRTILNAYGDAGFLHAKNTEKIATDTVGKHVDLEFSVEPGPAVVFDRLIIDNLRENDTTGAQGVTSTRLLRNLLSLRQGDTVSMSRLGSFERKLKSTRVFNYVRVRDSLMPDQDNRSAMILATEERIPGEMDVSAFYETQYGAGVAGNWDHANMRGQLHEGRLGASLAQRRQSQYLGYASPLFFGTSFRFDNDLVATWTQDSRLQQDAGLYEGDFEITNSARVSRALAAWSRYVGTTELAGKSEKVDTNRIDRNFNLNFINALFFSFLDDAVNPVKGLRWAFTWGNGGPFLSGGEVRAPTSGRHNWLEAESGFYYPVTERLKLAFRLDGGRFYGEGGINSERFFLGGPRSVRSYGFRQVCPERAGPVCVKEGLQPAYFLTSFEIRANPFFAPWINPEGKLRALMGLQVVPFVDYGNIWEVGAKLKPEGEGRSYGLGLRYSLLSIFNLRLDYAVDGPERKHDQWILDLAQAF
jgi:outer membrane protein insertion porin family